MHITNKALISIALAIAVILVSYTYFKQKHQVAPENQIQTTEEQNIYTPIETH